MVVCKYFLQGTCKFGNTCYNEHQTPSNNTNFSSTSILRQTSFGNPAQPARPPNSVDVNTLIKSVVTDMTLAEKGGQWLFSSYAPFKEKPAFPGFDDTSSEEIRLSYYEAQKSGNLAQYTQQLQDLLQGVILKVRALQNPSQEVINILLSIYNSPASSTSGTFGTSATIPTQNTGNIFQTQQASTNIFGGGSPQSLTQPNIFSNVANNTVNQAQGNIFANQGSPNIFATNQQPTNVFGGGTAATQSSQNIFPVGNTMTSPFNTVKTNQNIFASQPQQNIFSNQNQVSPTLPQNIFAQSAPTPIDFGSKSNVFANSPNAQPTSIGVQSNPSSIFGGQHKVNQSIDESIYSKEEDLSEEVKKYYQNDVFDIMNIPDLPPTYSMCFGV
ncbi:hypothetical protein GWI33_009092 [Rhynchophorus ferrugineus]|uniref:Nucleoporin NUP42 n=1 Tax=Rhynchophorus ferrugineus TaxID=354439 RepID=A0A834IDS6_RHYFE|nr:hypothetical protein GWI33_009092 [Rhynchophorus ferrugineus]